MSDHHLMTAGRTLQCTIQLVTFDRGPFITRRGHLACLMVGVAASSLLIHTRDISTVRVLLPRVNQEDIFCSSSKLLLASAHHSNHFILSLYLFTSLIQCLGISSETCTHHGIWRTRTSKNGIYNQVIRIFNKFFSQAVIRPAERGYYVSVQFSSSRGQSGHDELLGACTSDGQG